MINLWTFFKIQNIKIVLVQWSNSCSGNWLNIFYYNKLYFVLILSVARSPNKKSNQYIGFFYVYGITEISIE